MAWTLDIHTIDVGQGESSFVVAQDPTVPNATWTMLIDAGRPAYAETVHDYVEALGVPVHTIVTSHYDDDHSGGVRALLTADNVYAIADAIAAATAANGLPGASRPRLIAGYTAAAASAALGATPGDAGIAATAARLAVDADDLPDNDASTIGEDQALGAANAGQWLVRAPRKRGQVQRAVGLAAAEAALDGDDVRTEARDAAMDLLLKTVPEGCRFDTGGRYASTRVIDIGPAPSQPADWAQVTAGRCLQSTLAVQAPGINRARLGPPALGSEVLSTGVAGVALRTANDPGAYVVAVNRATWPAGQVIPGIGLDNNADGIGLILRFNAFFFWTAGDLPLEGEDMVGPALMAHGLRNPAVVGGTYPLPDRIACIKCGHHGSSTSTSAVFLGAVRPAGAMISAGQSGNEHPDAPVVTRVDAAAARYYLTNCNYPRAEVPRSQVPQQDQLPPPNKSRVAGNNRLPNLALLHQRGDIRLRITEAQSTAAPGPGRAYQVRYWEPQLVAPRVETTPF